MPNSFSTAAMSCFRNVLWLFKIYQEKNFESFTDNIWNEHIHEKFLRALIEPGSCLRSMGLRGGTVEAEEGHQLRVR